MPTERDLKPVKIWIEKGIVHLVFEPETFLSLSLIKQVVQHRISLFHDKDYPLFIDFRNVLSMETAARKFLKSDEASLHASAAAIQVGSPVSRFLVNLFITVDKPGKPIRMFTDKTRAIAWLKKFK
jgi:hypothetical protein